jgi:hypothetical protein
MFPSFSPGLYQTSLVFRQRDTNRQQCDIYTETSSDWNNDIKIFAMFRNQLLYPLASLTPTESRNPPQSFSFTFDVLRHFHLLRFCIISKACSPLTRTLYRIKTMMRREQGEKIMILHHSGDENISLRTQTELDGKL